MRPPRQEKKPKLTRAQQRRNQQLAEFMKGNAGKIGRIIDGYCRLRQISLRNEQVFSLVSIIDLEVMVVHAERNIHDAYRILDTYYLKKTS
jgi:Na+/phosphate symporter